jgi:hypothetical protein
VVCITINMKKRRGEKLITNRYGETDFKGNYGFNQLATPYWKSGINPFNTTLFIFILFLII